MPLSSFTRMKLHDQSSKLTLIIWWSLLRRAKVQLTNRMSNSWTLMLQRTLSLSLFSVIFWLSIFLPIQTGFNGSCAPESATNPFAHSHLYDPMVLLQTSLAPQASGDWHSSKSTKVKKNMHSSWNEEKPSKLFVSCLVLGGGRNHFSQFMKSAASTYINKSVKSKKLQMTCKNGTLN